jgi:hypothetical protein
MDEEETYVERGRQYYAETGFPVWPSRHREHPSAKPGDQEHLGPLANSSYVRLLLDRLDNLEKKTRPSAGSVSAERKDFAAFEALELAGDLVEHVAGWAIDHQMGLAAEQLKFVPLQPSRTKEHPQYLCALAIVDDHTHEKANAKLKIRDPGESVVARRAIINLLRANPGAMPSCSSIKQ